MMSPATVIDPTELLYSQGANRPNKQISSKKSNPKSGKNYLQKQQKSAGSTCTNYNTWLDGEHRMGGSQSKKCKTRASCSGAWAVFPWGTQSAGRIYYRTYGQNNKYQKKMSEDDMLVFYWRCPESDGGESRCPPVGKQYGKDPKPE